MDTIQAFIEANPEVQDELRAQAESGKTSFSIDDVKAAAAAHGIDASALEGVADEGELSEEALAGVTGGGRISFNLGGYTININTPW